MELNHSTLHHHILQHMIATGRVPTVAEMSTTFATSQATLVAALRALEAYHGVVLHPKSAEVWVIHPFATAPSNFWIATAAGGWWGTCAWCSLGAAALLAQDCTITTTLGGQTEQVRIDIRDGQIQRDDLWVHFPIPMVQAWDNVTFTCSTMLVFASEADVEAWSARHGIPQGDVQPIKKIWEFAQVWYGNHLNPNWQKWTVNEARAIFERFGLVHPIWKMPEATGRF